jgi:hypothetical protein
MIETQTDLGELKAKVQNLINLHGQLKEEARQLESLNARLSQKLDDQKNKFKELENQNKALRVAQALNQGGAADQNARDLKLKINEYIREIDKCLAFLHK